MAEDLLTAFALLLIIEGLLPGLAPSTWRKFIREASNLQTTAVRGVGIACMLAGAVLLYFLT